jgi:hypothetical protein
MEVRSRPPRIFGSNNTLINFEYIPALGKDIILKYKLKEHRFEKIYFFDEFRLNQSKISSTVQIILTDIRLVYVMVIKNLKIEKYFII